MASAHDVAHWLLVEHGALSAGELFALLYYCQGWSLAWDEAPLFADHIEAWPRGPVVREVWERHAGEVVITAHEGDPSELTKAQRETLAAVLAFYSAFSSQELVELVRIEGPWQTAFAKLSVSEPAPEIAPSLLMQHFAAFRRYTVGKVLPEALRRGHLIMLRLSPIERAALHSPDDVAEADHVERQLAALHA